MQATELLRQLNESMVLAEAEQREIEARYSGSNWTGPAMYDLVRRNPRWQYLDGLRVAFNTAHDFACDLEVS